ncbi:hypothetical protein LV457_14840 [Mycobacterium sp. MYCO198283]|uniref:Rv1476 family membrane protein n=1 Tax=Mycobacterium sp. MYCO198283 TaxID=2883505 RepID=UPI001E43CD85|nr:DUF6676 family protein [Mycobacterium sp. MYCO198283]MCG5433555.1 hypothetical protein [Mycobacterium sp. MYCO198283]
MPAPMFIPAELCTTVGLDPANPDACVDAVVADVADDAVAAPGADVGALRQVVADAAARGVDLKIVVLASNPPRDEPLRDIATEVGSAYPDATVLVLSPSYVGTYSSTFDRSTLEAGQDVAKTGNPVQSAQNFVGEITSPQFPWTAWTIALVVLVAGAVAGTRWLQRRARAVAAGRPDPAPADAD